MKDTNGLGVFTKVYLPSVSLIVINILYHQDWLIRNKEYEREKRLLKRKLRKEKAAAVGEEIKRHLNEEKQSTS
jgi:hypothetical protein